MEVLQTQCCIAGGGPAGMMLGYLMARVGVQTVVLEKHSDFLRDFRGDTVHPSTMQVMKDLGLLEEFLKLPHSRVAHLSAIFGEEHVAVADFSRLKTPCPFIAFMPQWDFLNFLMEKGRSLPALRVVMQAEVTGLVQEGGHVRGVTAKTPEDDLTVYADLTVGADGRRSTVREAAAMQVKDIGAPIDVLWFRVQRDAEKSSHDFGHVSHGHFLITIDRNEYWQCAYVIPKGAFEQVKAKGIEQFRREAAETAPVLAAHIHDVKSFDDVKLLTVGINLLSNWSVPGLLCIGDAAHTMSPVGGVGINLAVQDAVATANLLAKKLAAGMLTDSDVKKVQARREFPARMVQRVQVMIQDKFLTQAIGGGMVRVPWVARMASHSSWLRGLAARVIGLGIRPERVQL